jgi:hypothetical protein
MLPGSASFDEREFKVDGDPIVPKLTGKTAVQLQRFDLVRHFKLSQAGDESPNNSEAHRTSVH